MPFLPDEPDGAIPRLRDYGGLGALLKLAIGLIVRPESLTYLKNSAEMLNIHFIR